MTRKRKITGKAPAYHEAGHAVARWVLLEEAAPVYLDFDEDGFLIGGRTGHATERVMSFHEHMLRNIGSAAGPLAQARYSRTSQFAAWIDGGQSDEEAIYASLDAWGLPHANFDNFCKSASRLLAMSWLAVTRVAEALHEHKQLSAAEVMALVTEAA